jgi:iron complex transport system substrate-binding protein
MKRLLFVLLTLTLLVTACAPAATAAPTAIPTLAPAPTTPPITAVPPTTAPTLTSVPTTSQAINLSDGLGRKVSLPAPAKKIVSMAPSNSEILFAIGAGGQVIGRDDLSDYPAEVKKLPTVGGSMGKYSYEQIAALQPDLVLASGLNTPDQIKAIEDLKLNIYYLANPTDLSGLYANLETVGTLTGHLADAQKLVTSLQARQKAVVDALASIKDHPKVFYELDASDPAKPYTVGANTFIDILIKMAGGTNIGAALKGDYPQISQEELLAQNPDIILLGDAAYGAAPDKVGARPGWDKINAVTNHKVFAFDDNTVSRPGPRLIDGLETLAKLLHPEAFK